MNRIKTESTALNFRFQISNPKSKTQNPKWACSSLLISLFGFGLLLAVCFAVSSSILAQVVDFPQPPHWQKSDETDTVRIDADLVDLNVSVFARDRQRGGSSSTAVGPLQQKDFT